MSDTAQFLFELRRDNRRVEALPDELCPANLAAGYREQNQLVEALCNQWSTEPSGYKIALTNPAAQALLGVGHPIFGRLIRSTSYDSGAALVAADYQSRVIEVELAFVMATDVPDAVNLTSTTIKAHVASLHPAIEVVNHRFAGLDRFNAQTLAADNAIHGAFVLGPPVENWTEGELPGQPVSLRVNGEQKVTGAGDRALGNPLSALAWLANALPEYGLRLKAGDVVTTGLLTDGVYEANAGDALVGDFAAAGKVEMTFV